MPLDEKESPIPAKNFQKLGGKLNGKLLGRLFIGRFVHYALLGFTFTCAFYHEFGISTPNNIPIHFITVSLLLSLHQNYLPMIASGYKIAKFNFPFK